MVNRRYPRTPAQRAALRKAQLASARKRRRARFVAGAKIAGTIAGAAAVYGAQSHLNKWASNPRSAVKDFQDLHGATKGVARRVRGRGTDPAAPHMPKLIRTNSLGHSRRSVRHAMGRGTSRRVAGRRVRR